VTHILYAASFTTLKRIVKLFVIHPPLGNHRLDLSALEHNLLLGMSFDSLHVAVVAATE
jgi:hypothetical protein